MNATEALIYCLGFRDDLPEDGEYRSQTAYDTYGNPHWVAWRHGVPKLCSEAFEPFADHHGPYRTCK